MLDGIKDYSNQIAVKMGLRSETEFLQAGVSFINIMEGDSVIVLLQYALWLLFLTLDLVIVTIIGAQCARNWL